MKELNIAEHQIEAFEKEECEKEIDKIKIKLFNEFNAFIMYEQVKYLYLQVFKPAFEDYPESTEPRGKLIILTGIFHTGKSTLINYIYTHLKRDFPDYFLLNEPESEVPVFYPVYSVRYNASIKNKTDLILWLCAKIGNPIPIEMIQEWRRMGRQATGKTSDIFVYENGLKTFMITSKKLKLRLLFIDEIQRIEGLRIDLVGILDVFKDLSDQNAWKENGIYNFKTCITLVGTDKFQTYLSNNAIVQNTIEWFTKGAQGRTKPFTLKALNHRGTKNINGVKKRLPMENCVISEFEQFIVDIYTQYRKVGISSKWKIVSLKDDDDDNKCLLKFDNAIIEQIYLQTKGCAGLVWETIREAMLHALRDGREFPNHFDFKVVRFDGKINELIEEDNKDRSDFDIHGQKTNPDFLDTSNVEYEVTLPNDGEPINCKAYSEHGLRCNRKHKPYTKEIYLADHYKNKHPNVKVLSAEIVATILEK